MKIEDVAKLACLKIGKSPQFEWEEVNRVVKGLEEIGVLSRPSNSLKDAYWVINKELFTKAGIRFNQSSLMPNKILLGEKVKYSFCESISEWLMKNGMTSKNGSQYITSVNPVISYCLVPFDYLGFSHVRGIKKLKNKEGVPIVGDVIPITVCGMVYAKSFKQRVVESYSVRKVWPLSFILAKGFHRDAHS